MIQIIEIGPRSRSPVLGWKHPSIGRAANSDRPGSWDSSGTTTRDEWRVQCTGDVVGGGLYRKIGNSKNGNSVFFPSKTALLTSFDIFVVTYRVINFSPKLVDMLLFSAEKTEFPFLVFPYFPVVLGRSPHLHQLQQIYNPWTNLGARYVQQYCPSKLHQVLSPGDKRCRKVESDWIISRICWTPGQTLWISVGKLYLSKRRILRYRYIVSVTQSRLHNCGVRGKVWNNKTRWNTWFSLHRLEVSSQFMASGRGTRQNCAWNWVPSFFANFSDLPALLGLQS